MVTQWKSVYKWKNCKYTRDKELRLQEDYSLVECLTLQPFNFLLKSLLSVFGVQSD